MAFNFFLNVLYFPLKNIKLQIYSISDHDLPFT